MHSRRKFIQTGTLGFAGSLALPLISNATHATGNNKAGNNLFPVGIAGYTFVKFSLDESIAMMKRLDLHYISVKDFHLPLDSSPEKIKEVLGRFAAANIKAYTVGVIYMKTKEAVDQAFAYARAVGVDMIVGVPNYELLDYTEEKVKAYNIRIAIHNHGPEDKLYTGPKDVYEHIRNRDIRMGLCLDIGHAQRTGISPAEAVITYQDRMFDFHIKDVTAAEKDGKAIEAGRGVIDFRALVAALVKIKYKGICSIEFEKDMGDPLAGIAESAGYFKGIMNGINN